MTQLQLFDLHVSTEAVERRRADLRIDTKDPEVTSGGGISSQLFLQGRN